MRFRDLTAREIDARVGQVGEGWATLLLYKDARVDMDILDETVGCENWQRRHYDVKGNMYCSVGIKINNEWIWKDDCGTESKTEKEKGESSDSFKRACVNWGIGRELYTSPKIFINCKTDKKQIVSLKDFEVSEITIQDKIIKALKITAYNKNKQTRERVFEWELNTIGKSAQKPQNPLEIMLTLEDAKKMKTAGGVELDKLNEGQLNQLVNCKNKTYSKAAQMILDDRVKSDMHLEEMAEGNPPWEE